MLNLRPARCPIDGSHRVEIDLVLRQSHINRRENDQFMDFFSLFLLEQDKRGEKSVQKSRPAG